MKRLFILAAAGALAGSMTVHAQGPAGRGQTAAATTPRSGALIDLTGYWVSLVTDDWRYRMLTPPKGNVDNIPVTPEGRRVANEWDPAKDEAAGEQCRGYGAVGVMRLPGRLHITWASDTTLQVETDAGTQTRRFSFATPAAPVAAGVPGAAPVAPSLQGMSAARWVAPTNRAGGPGRTGELRVVTTNLKPGYIRKNGVPYSANAVLTENFARLADEDGTVYLALTQMVEDPVYLQQPIIRTMLFKQQRDAAGWTPTPCSAR
jgi:hypothetical protein